MGVLCSYRHPSGSERQSLTEMMVRCAVCGSKMISIGDTWFAITIVEYYGRPSPLLLFHFFFPPPSMYHPVQPSVAHDAFHPEHVCILSPSLSLSLCTLQLKTSLLIDPVATAARPSPTSRVQYLLVERFP